MQEIHTGPNQVLPPITCVLAGEDALDTKCLEVTKVFNELHLETKNQNTYKLYLLHIQEVRTSSNDSFFSTLVDC